MIITKGELNCKGLRKKLRGLLCKPGTSGDHTHDACATKLRDRRGTV